MFYAASVPIMDETTQPRPEPRYLQAAKSAAQRPVQQIAPANAEGKWRLNSHKAKP
jgi:hypothetical protein